MANLLGCPELPSCRSQSVLRRSHIYINGPGPTCISNGSCQTYAAKCSAIQWVWNSPDSWLWLFKQLYADMRIQRFLLHARVTLICRPSTRHQGYNKKDTCLGVSALTEGGDRNTGIQQRRESQRVWAKVIWGRSDLPCCFRSGPYSKSSSGSHRSCTAHCIWSSTHRCHNDPGWGSLKSPWPPSDLSVTTGCCPGTWRARHTCQGHRIRGAFPESASKEPGNADFWGDASTWRAPLPR